MGLLLLHLVGPHLVDHLVHCLRVLVLHQVHMVRKAGPLPFLLKPANWLPVVAVPAKVSAAAVVDIAEL